MSKVLLIEDDIEMQKEIKEYLENFNFEVDFTDNGLEAVKKIKSYDIVILDLMLPKIDGFDVLKKIKKITDIPVIISSARGDIGNKIMGFEIGADDYLAKPYEPRELVLRLNSLLKRYKKGNILEIGDFYINENDMVVKLDDYEINFTKVEFEIFLYLVKNAGKVISREQILNATSLHPDTRNRTIDMHISNIRAKIGDDSKNPKYIKSVWGIGYKFV
ncbi:response regulator transcription factor [Caminibacter profundus]